jgi:hypothetical protein
MHQSSSVKATPRITPGHLLAPFGWAADSLASMVEAEPTLLIHLFELNPARMHLIALTFAHLNEIPPNISALLVTGSILACTREPTRELASGFSG